MRIGNAASGQFQLDVYGEVLDALHQARARELEISKEAWALQRQLLRYLEDAWKEPDEGIWEVRGPRRHFTHSKVMAWVAFDRGVQAVERFGRNGPVERWREIRSQIHAEVCDRGFDVELNSFTQSYGEQASRRKPADHSARRVPAGRRSAHGRDRRRDRAGALPRRLHLPLLAR